MDIRLSEEVEKKANDNEVYVAKKGIELMEKFRVFLEKEFEGKYDETYFLSLYIRKGNDVNTLSATQLLLWWYNTPADLAMIKFFANNQNTVGTEPTYLDD